MGRFDDYLNQGLKSMVATDDEGNPTGDTKIDISGSESGTAVLQCALMLSRTDAKIEVC